MEVQSFVPRRFQERVRGRCLDMASRGRSRDRGFFDRFVNFFRDDRVEMYIRLVDTSEKPDCVEVVLNPFDARRQGVDYSTSPQDGTVFYLNILEDLTVHQNSYTYQRYRDEYYGRHHHRGPGVHRRHAHRRGPDYRDMNVGFGRRPGDYARAGRHRRNNFMDDGGYDDRDQTETIEVRYLSVNLTQSGYSKLWFLRGYVDSLDGPHFEEDRYRWDSMGEFIYHFYVLRSKFMQMVHYKDRLNLKEKWFKGNGALSKREDYVPLRLALYQPVISAVALDIKYDKDAQCCGSGEVYKHGFMEYFTALDALKQPIYHPVAGLSTQDHQNVLSVLDDLLRDGSLEREFASKNSADIAEFEYELKKASKARGRIAFFCVAFIPLFLLSTMLAESGLEEATLVGMGLAALSFFIGTILCLRHCCFGSVAYTRVFRSLQVKYMEMLGTEMRKNEVARKIYSERGLGLKFVHPEQLDYERGTNDKYHRNDHTYQCIQNIHFPLILLFSPMFDKHGELIPGERANSTNFLTPTVKLDKQQPIMPAVEYRARPRQESSAPPAYDAIDDTYDEKSGNWASFDSK